jgi:hypothetical protein
VAGARSPFPEISWSDYQDLLRCAGALRTIRDKRLYRETHDNFYAYCQDTFGLPKHLVLPAFECLDNERN